MIYIDRNSVLIPEAFFSRQIEIAKKRLEEFYHSSENDRRQKRFSRPFDAIISKGVKESLKELFKNKCAYCESLIPPATTIGDIDNFRPKGGSRGLDKDFSNDHYWWLTYEWNNLYYSCQMCNRYKSNWFPVEGHRANVSTPYNEIIFKEYALLIDPCHDRPEEHLLYNEDSTVDFLTSKGKVTIDILKLNRQELVHARATKLKELYSQWELLTKLFVREKTSRRKIRKIAEDWELLFTQHSEISYLGIQRFMLSKWINSRPDIRDYLSDRKYDQIELRKEVLTQGNYIQEIKIHEILQEEEKLQITERLNIGQLQHVYIEKIEIVNFKCFSTININFNKINETEYDNDVSEEVQINEPWLLFLGENGVGKSSLLKAITIGLCGGDYLKNLNIKGADILKKGEESGYIKINLVGEIDPIIVTFNIDEIKASINLPVVNLVAYNSIRLGPIKRKLIPESKIFKNIKVKNLFDYSVSLIDADEWLLNKNQIIFDRVSLTLKDLMMLEDSDSIEKLDNKIVVKRNDEILTIAELSDGYQSVYTLAVDIMATFAGENSSFDLVEGMVLIDEIGTHLHPRWRMQVVERLRNAFPKIQFVVTTHEPLCLRGLKAEETVVLTKDADNEVVALTDLPNPSELRVDQILTSDFFGLNSTIDPKTEKLFEEYYGILVLDEDKRTDEQKNRLLILNSIIPKIKHLGDSLREELIYYVVDELLAQKTRKDGLKLVEDLKEEAVNRVASLWKLIESENKHL